MSGWSCEGRAGDAPRPPGFRRNGATRIGFLLPADVDPRIPPSPRTDSDPPAEDGRDSPESEGTLRKTLRPMDRPAESATQGAAPPSDPELVQRVLRGDPDAFRILMERHQNHVHRLALRLSGGDAERAADLSQEAFLRAYRGLDGYGHDAKFSTWLHRITVNVAISRTRKERALKRGKALSLDASYGEDERPMQVEIRGVGPAASVVADEGCRAILQAIESLDPDLHALVVLVNLEGHSYESAAEILSIPVGTVRSRLHRAREILTRRLAKRLQQP